MCTTYTLHCSAWPEGGSSIQKEINDALAFCKTHVPGPTHANLQNTNRRLAVKIWQFICFQVKAYNNEQKEAERVKAAAAARPGLQPFGGCRGRGFEDGAGAHRIAK